MRTGAQKSALFLFIFSLTMISNSFAEGLERLFTTPEDRARLEEIIHSPPPEETSTVVTEEESAELELILLPEIIILRGLVHRSDGKNAAWINNGNTFEGNMGLQDIKINASDIKADQVQITMPDETTRVELKVGKKVLLRRN